MTSPSCPHCGSATVPGYVCLPCGVAASDDLEVLLAHRKALDAIFALCGHDPKGAECLNDPDFGETVCQAVEEVVARSRRLEEAMRAALDGSTAENGGYPVCAWCRDAPCSTECPTHGWRGLLVDHEDSTRRGS